MSEYLSFFKKKAAPAVAAAPAAGGLENISFYTMPKPAAGGGAAAHPTKKWGLFIVGGGGLLLVGGVVLLVWYIFFTGNEPQPAVLRTPAVTQTPAPVAQPAPPDAAAPAAESAAVTAPVVDDLAEQDCGSTALTGSEAVLTCIGERILDDCKRAAAMLDTETVTGIRLAVLGLRQDKCLVQLTYPAAAAIPDAAMQAYANTYLRCPYDAKDLSRRYDDAAEQVGSYVYEQSAVENLTSGRTCEGTAVTVWQERLAETEAEPGSFIPGLDTDGDGLTDVEETAVFATVPATADTDTDGYDDGTEVANGYNPAGGGTLAESGLVEIFDNTAYRYRVSYPRTWRVEDAVNGANIIFFSATGGFIQVVAQENTGGGTLAQWYADSVAAAPAAAIDTLADGRSVLYSPDGLTAYVMDGEDRAFVYVVTYSPGDNGRLEFLATLHMVVRTLSVE